MASLYENFTLLQAAGFVETLADYLEHAQFTRFPALTSGILQSSLPSLFKAALVRLVETARSTGEQARADQARLLSLHHALIPAIQRQDGIQVILNALQESLKGACWLFDASGHLMEASNAAEIPPPRDVIQRMRISSPAQTLPVSDESNYWMEVLALAQDQPIGFLVIRRTGIASAAVEKGEVALCASFLTFIIGKEQTMRWARVEACSTLLTTLLSLSVDFPGHHEEPLIHRAAILGKDLREPQVLLMVVPPFTSNASRPQEAQRMLHTFQALLAAEHFPFCTVVEDEIVVMISNDQWVETHAHTLYSLSMQQFPDDATMVIVSEPCRRLEEYPLTLTQMHKVAAWVKIFHPAQKIVRIASVPAAVLLFDIANTTQLQQFTVKQLGILAQYDRKHHSELLDTLETFLACECQMRVAAEQLHLHYNSLRYRLDRIQQILEINLDDHRVRENLRLAFLLNRTFAFTDRP
ncbi:MAG: helix-turn-helix domain-containing protein [Firmicutes bacterium]|nr:helix-turn-helix domain-containing protein [Bacillota bacterium]